MVSVIVITKNEEDRIRTCLESVKWADEVIVADSGSTDKTVEIAKKYTEKVLTCKGNNFSSWRNEAMEQANGDWVLYVDADERVLEPLKEEILSLTKETDCSVFAISRRNIIFGSEAKYGPFWPDWVIRLFKKSDFETWTGDIHESVKFKGKLGYTKNSLLHLTHRGIDHVVLKSLDWSRADAKLRLDANHPRMSGWRFLRIFVTELFYQGIIRRGFFSGTVGVMDSILQAFSLYISYVRLWEIQQLKPLERVYQDLDQELIDRHFKY